MFRQLQDRFAKRSAILVLWLLVQTSFAQNGNSGYLISKNLYSNIDGLPSREITCAAQDNFGYMWFATRNGLCRFDGQKFLVFNATNSRLYYNNIRSIYFDKQEGIIINFNSRSGYYAGLVNELQVINTRSLKIKKFNDYYPECPFRENQVADILETVDSANLIFRLAPYDNMRLDLIANSKTYILTAKGLFKLYDDHIAKTISFHGEGARQIARVGQAGNKPDYRNSAYLISCRGQVIHNPQFRLPVFHIYNDQEGGIFGCEDGNRQAYYFYIGANGRVLSLERHKKFRGHLFNKDFNYYPIHGSDWNLEIDDKNTWRLVHLSRGDLLVIDFSDGESFKRAKVLYVFRDHVNNYWFCTTEGLVKITIRQNQFAKHLTLQQLPGARDHSVRGMLRVGHKTFVSLPDAVAVTAGKKTEFIPNNRNFGILRHGNTVLIAGGNSIIAYDLLTGKNRPYRFLDVGEIWSLLPLDSNTVMVFGTEQIIRYNLATGERKTVRNACKIRPNACYRVAALRNGDHLLVGESGVFVLSRKLEITHCFSRNATDKRFYLPIEHINDVHVDSRDTAIYWLASAYDGLYQWNRASNRLTRYGLPNGFLSETCYRIEEDRYQNLWVSTDYGIAKFNKQRKEAIVYTEKDGIAHNEFNRASSYVDENGMMYFGGINGYTTFYPEKFLWSEIEVAPLVITKISSFNIETNSETNELNRFWENKRLELTTNERNLTIGVSLLDYETGQNQYAYQIQGYNKQWQFTNEGHISVNSLPYGSYVLLVKAQNSHGRWLSGNMLRIPLEVVKPYYETWWFYTLVACGGVLLIALVFYGIYKAKLRSIKRLSDLRLSIATDLHDEVGGLLNKTAIQSELMQSRQKEKNEVLSKIAMNNRTALSSMRDIIWNLDPRNDHSESLIDRLNDYTQKMLADDYDYTITIQDIEHVRLKHEIRQNLNLIFKEAINNIVKHASAGSRVAIELNIIDRVLVLRIWNAGNYNLPEKRSGQGLLNMEMRAKKMKGKCEVSFEEGVEIRISVPLSH